MAYPYPFARLVASGTLFGVETFSFGLTLIRNAPPNGQLDAATKVVQCATILKAYLNTSATGSGAVLKTVKLNEVGTDGKYVSKTTAVTYDIPSPSPGLGSVAVPPQIALAITLGTANKRGPAHAGRFYHPLPTATVASDGMVATSFALAHADAAAKLVNDINALWAGFWRVGVVSDVGAGAQNAVTSVKVGRVLDTLRSRRAKFSEAYVSAATAIA